MKYLGALLVLLPAAFAVDFVCKNSVPQPIWVGILGNHGKPTLAKGGFVLNPGESMTVNAPNDWAGRFWARTWCNPNSKHCETGDCGNKLECNEAGGAPPTTLVEIDLRGHEGQDFYDISLVDGFNVGGSIQPLGGTGNCRTLKCVADINKDCPNELRQREANNQALTIGCKSSCNVYNTDQYCCRNAYNTSQTCKTDAWAVNSASYFKRMCPDAYNYAFDDPTSTFTCVANVYIVEFS